MLLHKVSPAKVLLK